MIDDLNRAGVITVAQDSAALTMGINRASSSTLDGIVSKRLSLLDRASRSMLQKLAVWVHRQA